MDNQERRKQDRSRQIQELSQNIEELSARLNKLIIEEANEDTFQVQSGAAQPSRKEELQIGDTVEILNNYKGFKGSQGTIVNITAFQVSIRLSGQRKVINRRKTNVKKVSLEQE
jgi:uncharacterized Zn ribbon protein